MASWFEEEFGFVEKSVKIYLSKINFEETQHNIFQFPNTPNKAFFYAGRFDCLSVATLNEMLEGLKQNKSDLKLEDFCYLRSKEEVKSEDKESISNNKKKVVPEKKDPDNNLIQLKTSEGSEKPLDETDKSGIKQPNDSIIANKKDHDKNLEAKKKSENMEEETKSPLNRNDIPSMSLPFNEFFEKEIKKGLIFDESHEETLHFPVQSLIKKNEGGIFQVASQFNCLEMVGPKVTPGSGITQYYLDETQGPACALACRSALFFRNYLVSVGKNKGGGQLTQQINLLDDVEKYLKDNKISTGAWRIQNGYCLIDNPKHMDDLNSLLVKDENLVNEIRKRIKIGVHWDTETLSSDKKNKTVSDISQRRRVCQVFCSTLSLAYDKQKKDLKIKGSGNKFCQIILEAMYEATVAVAGILAYLKQKRLPVFFTAVGGGVFGNPKLWIRNAIQRAIDVHGDLPLNVYLVNYTSVPKAYQNIKSPNKT